MEKKLEIKYEGNIYFIEKENFIAKDEKGNILILAPRGELCKSCSNGKELKEIKAVKCTKHKLPFKATGKCNFFEEGIK